MKISQINTGDFPSPPAARTGAISPVTPSPPSKNDSISSALHDSQVKDAVLLINKAIHNMSANTVSFVTDSITGIDTVSVINSETKEVIRQMPSEEAITASRALDKMQGIVIHQKA
jgi:flagellar protein FlaG